MRPQYHLRKSEKGLLAWDVRNLIARARDVPSQEIPLHEIRELDESFWFDQEGNFPTCRSIAQHALLIENADLSHPIILDPDGRVMDGMHRVCQALNRGLPSITACRLPVLPEPDFVGVAPHDLPYESDPQNL